MSEILGNRYEEQENRNNQSISVFDGDKYHNDIQSFYLKNKGNYETVNTLKDFLSNQEQDKNNIKEQLEKPILQEAREGLDKQAMINEAKTMLYEKMGISNNLGDNKWGENCGKGLVDTLIIDNYDLAIQVWETNGTVIIDGITELFSSWENFQKVADALGESIMGLVSGDGYETGKSLAELGLIGSGVGIGVYAGKKTVKFGIKQAARFRKNAENIVSSPNTKQVIGEVNNKVNEIIPKQEVSIEDLAKKRVDIKQQIEGLEKLGIPENFSKDMLESGLMNEKFIGGDLLKRFEALQRKGINYETMIDNAMKKIPNLTKEDALLIFSYTDATIYENLNGYMRGIPNFIDKLTPENIKTTNKLIGKLENALEKMPNMEGRLIYRGDDWVGYKGDIGEKIELKSFTSVSNIEKDTFLSESKNISLIIEGKQGRVKDISSLAMFVNFAKKIGRTPTVNEGVILPNSIVKIVGKDVIDKKIFLVDEIRMKQLK